MEGHKLVRVIAPVSFGVIQGSDTSGLHAGSDPIPGCAERILTVRS